MTIINISLIIQLAENQSYSLFTFILSFTTDFVISEILIIILILKFYFFKKIDVVEKKGSERRAKVYPRIILAMRSLSSKYLQRGSKGKSTSPYYTSISLPLL